MRSHAESSLTFGETRALAWLARWFAGQPVKVLCGYGLQWGKWNDSGDRELREFMSNSVLRTKPVERILSEAQEHEGGLKRVLSAVDLTAIGVGAIIGAGIFVLTGTAARDAAGPAIMLSYVFAGLACILAALCYAEFATRLPISGSAYTYAYASVGELFAWIIGWDLILEYTIGSSTVAVGWTHYLDEFIRGYANPESPLWLQNLAQSWIEHSKSWLAMPMGPFEVNIPAVLLIALLTTLLCIGIKESSRFNAVMVAVKLAVVLFVIFAGIPWVQPQNWDPFFPYGVGGALRGAALIFFAYIGFDAVSTAAEETRNPQRDLPIGIIASLLICTLLYVAVSAVITGMVPYQQIDAGAPLAAAFGSVGNELARKLIGLGGFVGLTTVVLILLMSQPRIWFAMSRDGLLSPWFSKVHSRFRTPINATLLTGVIAILMAATVPMEELHVMVSIGTLFAFVVVSASVLINRYKTPEQPETMVKTVLWLLLGVGLLCFGVYYGLVFDAAQPITIFKMLPAWKQSYLLVPSVAKPIFCLVALVGGVLSVWSMAKILRAKQTFTPETFKCPWVPFIPLLAIIANMAMMVTLELDAWLRLWVWLAAGMVIYAWYGREHSKLNQPK